MAVLLFVPAGTIDYWQVWLYLAVFVGASAFTTADLAKRDPELLERRMRGGPTAEKDATQRVIMVLRRWDLSRCWSFRRSTTMYASALFYLLGTPLAPGSYWGLVAFVGMVAVLIWRLLEEERMLVRDLPGYAEYQARVRYRLVPSFW